MTRHRTAAALRELATQERRPWPDVIREYAERGYSWSDVAELIGVPATNLKAYCYYRNLKFPWQGQRSPIMRAHQSRMMAGRTPPPRGHYKRYTAFGVTDTLPQLAQRFGTQHGITYETLRRRITKTGMDPETALTTPLMTRHERGVYGNRCRRKERINPWESTNGSIPPANSGL
jgi:hypothetical protein